MIFNLDSSTILNSDELLGIEFEADGSLTLGVGLISQGTRFFRNYPPTEKGEKNLILLNRLGFKDSDKISNIETVEIFFYTNQQQKVVNVKTNRLVIFRNRQQLYRYFDKIKPSLYVE